MSNSFVNKVSAERKVLKAVNSQANNLLQLAGLSSPAIHVWARGAGRVATPEVVSQLLRLAEICQTLSDRSHESFKSLDPSIYEDIERRVNVLQKTISSAKG